VYPQPSAPETIGEVLDNAIELFKATIVSVLGLAFASGFAASLPNLMAPPAPQTGDGGELLVFDFLADTLVLIGVTLVAFTISLYFGLGVLAQMSTAERGGGMSWQEASMTALRRFPKVFLCCLVLAVVASVVSFPGFIGGAVFVTLFGFSNLTSPFGPILIFATGMLCALIPVVILMVYWCFAVPLIVIENAGVVDALQRSWSLARRNFWRTLVVLTLAGFIYTVVVAVVALVAALSTVLDNEPALRLLLLVVNAIGGTFTTPLVIAVILALLKDATMRREGQDLLRRLQAIDG